MELAANTFPQLIVVAPCPQCSATTSLHSSDDRRTPRAFKCDAGIAGWHSPCCAVARRPMTRCSCGGQSNSVGRRWTLRSRPLDTRTRTKMLQENGGTHLKEERDSIHFVVFLIERDAHSHTCTHTRTPTADGYCCFLVLRSMLTSKLPPLHGNSGGSGRICTSSSDDAGGKKETKRQWPSS